MKYILENCLQSITSETYLLTSILILIIYGVIYNTSLVNYRLVLIKNISIISIYTLLLSIFIIYHNPYIYTVTFNNTFINDNFTIAIKIIVLISAVCSILISLDYVKNQKIKAFEYSILILFSIIAMLLLTSSYSILSIYLSIELQSLCFYVLASMKRNSEYSTEASFKYFILGVFSSGFLLLGFSIIYGLTGISNIEQFYKFFTNVDNFYAFEYIGIYIGLILLIVSFLFKIGAVPFHMWLPDVYEGSPMSVTAFFAIVPKVVIISVIIRLFLSAFYEIIGEINNLFIYSSILSMMLASIAALFQTKIIRLFAYSAIGHIGYILVGISTGSIEAIQGCLIYIVIYIIMSINIYSTLVSIRSSNKTIEIKYIKELVNFSKSNPILAITFVTMLFSMAGIPPLAGFFSKLYIFYSAINSSMYLISLIGVITSVIACVYYIYIIRLMYFEKSNLWIFNQSISKELSILLAITFMIIVLLFIYSSPVLIYTHKLALFLSI